MRSALPLDSIALLTFSAEGACLAHRLQQHWPNTTYFLHELQPQQGNSISFARIQDLFVQEFHRFQGWVCIAPCGVIVRSIAPLIASKLSDPAVVVVDAGGRFAVSLLSGHEGGANGLAVQVGNILEAEPVISTTTDAVKTYIAGIGCRRGVSASVILDALDMALEQASLPRSALRFLASAQLKSQEAGLWEASRILAIPLRILPHNAIKGLHIHITNHPFVQDRVGLPGVAEPAALLGGQRTRLCLPRISHQGVTVALAQENCWSWESDQEAH